MALTSCEECGRQVSTRAACCPNCGAPPPAAPAPAPAPAATAPVDVDDERYGVGAPGKGGLSLAGFLALCFGIIAFVGIASKQIAATGETGPRALALDDRGRDSVAVLALRDSAGTLTRHRLLNLESTLHQGGFQVPHDSAHARLREAVIDSADAHLDNRSTGSPYVARLLLTTSYLGELTPEQERRRSRLLSQIQSWQRAVDRRAQRAVAEAQRQQAAGMLVAREAHARSVETQLLDEGMDVTVTTRGPRHETLRIKYILVSRVWAHQMSKNTEMFNALRQLGFKRLELTDGYDEEWYWTL